MCHGSAPRHPQACSFTYHSHVRCLFPPHRADQEGKTRFFVGVQVDVTAGTAGQPAPAWTKTASAEETSAKVGHNAANMIGTALQTMAYPVQNPWAAISGSVMRRKPHKADDKAYQALLGVQQRDQKLKLMHFRRVKQLGAGDVGLVDLVALQVCV